MAELISRAINPGDYLLTFEFHGDHGNSLDSPRPERGCSSVQFKKSVLPDTITVDCECMVLTGGSYPSFIFHVSAGGESIRDECRLIDPKSSCEPRTIQFTNAIRFGDKCYALSLQGTLAVIDFSFRPKITVLGAKRAIPSTCSKGFREMETLGDRTLLLGFTCCLSISASELGCRKNCIYFNQRGRPGWWVFDMKTCSISPGWNSNADSPDFEIDYKKFDTRGGPGKRRFLV
uniref:KIB1-4 beta-propeller domain-containing protein n=1 Tax=Nelumbo nucifera TaxID=4432 RepID=A0A822YZM3_NELNU|nr:TPA_asm: hypothetical protein HUJ06_008608 [Nelumbo nucifera]